tara:strand:- start:33 stop:512 length:480 start_codon:yes stop_codon:yes gene_type:complete
MSKECFKCHDTKPIDEFYVHSQMKDGHLGKCKACTRKDTEDRRHRLEKSSPLWVEKEKDRQRKKAAKRSERYPEKISAINAVRGSGAKGCHQHHWSYNKKHWKDVFLLAMADHNKAHRYMKYDEERRMYRGLDGVLLDMRESHLDYLGSLGITEHKDAQ